MKNRFLSAGWAKKRPVGRLGISPPPIFMFYKLECTEEKGIKKKMKYNFFLFQLALFRTFRRWTGNNFLFESGLISDKTGEWFCPLQICSFISGI